MVERREYEQDVHLSAKNVNKAANARWVRTAYNYSIYFTALSTMPFMKYFWRNRKITISGNTPRTAEAAAAPMLELTCAKKFETASVTEDMRGDCKK